MSSGLMKWIRGEIEYYAECFRRQVGGYLIYRKIGVFQLAGFQ
jgi:hypothetical protein